MTEIIPRTTSIVLDTQGLTIWASDPEHDTYTGISNPFMQRVGVFVNPAHVHLFISWSDFSEWLLSEQRTIEECWILGAELSDEERKP